MPSFVTVTVTVVPFGDSLVAVVDVISIPATSLPLSPVQPFFDCVSLTSADALPVLLSIVTSVVLAVSVNTADEHSAYAALILAKSVASLLFSNCDVKIGIRQAFIKAYYCHFGRT